MREIRASDAEANLLALLDDVERGETLIITRRGRAIARIVPVVDRPAIDRRQEDVDDAIASISCGSASAYSRGETAHGVKAPHSPFGLPVIPYNQPSSSQESAFRSPH